MTRVGSCDETQAGVGSGWRLEIDRPAAPKTQDRVGRIPATVAMPTPAHWTAEGLSRKRRTASTAVTGGYVVDQ
jgi:hypothetical protein